MIRGSLKLNRPRIRVVVEFLTGHNLNKHKPLTGRIGFPQCERCGDEAEDYTLCANTWRCKTMTYFARTGETKTGGDQGVNG